MAGTEASRSRLFRLSEETARSIIAIAAVGGVVLTLLGGMYGGVYVLLRDVEDRLTARMTTLSEEIRASEQRLSAEITRNREAIAENREAIAENRKAIAQLDGRVTYLYGLLDVPAKAGGDLPLPPE